MPNHYENRIASLERDLINLRAEFYRNNFTSNRDENKFVRFNSRVKAPKFSALPATCEVSEYGVFNGIFYVCSATNTWTKVGTQT